MKLDPPGPTTRKTGASGRRIAARSCLLFSFLFLASMTAWAQNGSAAGNHRISPYVPRLTSYFQLLYTGVVTGEDRLALRRFKAMLDGGPLNRLHYHLQFIYKTHNESATDNRIFLQDAYVVYPIGTGFALKAGQFIPPFGLERFEPDYKLDFVDRTEVTRRLVINGNLGDSFTRDRGIQGEWIHRGWDFAGGIFQGAGANNPPRGNGPLGVMRLSYGRKAPPYGRQWMWRAGLAASARRIADLDFSGQLPGLSKDLTSHFRGTGARLDTFVQGAWGPVSTQAEYYRVQLDPASGSDILAEGAYGQAVYLPFQAVTFGLRYEWFNPDVHLQEDLSLRQWTAAVTYGLPVRGLRLAADYSRADGASRPSSVWRVQLQYFLIQGFVLYPKL